MANDSMDIEVPLTSTYRALNVAIGCIGITLNLIVIVAFIRKPNMVSFITKVLIMNLSTVDGIASVFMIFAEYYGVSGTELPPGITWKDGYCMFFWSTYTFWALMATSTVNLEVITIERYLSIVHPVWHLNNFTKRQLVPILTFVNVSGFIHLLATSFGYFDEETQRCVFITRRRTVSLALGIWNYCFFLIIPLAILSFCYTNIIRVLRSRVGAHAAAHGLDAGNGGQTVQSAEELLKIRRNRNLAATFVFIGAAYVLCRAFNETLWFVAMQILGTLDRFGYPYRISVLLSSVNCCINPIIYAIKLETFRKWIRSVLCCTDGSSADSTAADRTGNMGANTGSNTGPAHALSTQQPVPDPV